jgi:hypothetical protein
MPECFYRASTLVLRNGYPLKACGYDVKKVCFQSNFSIKCRGQQPVAVRKKVGIMQANDTDLLPPYNKLTTEVAI